MKSLWLENWRMALTPPETVHQMSRLTHRRHNWQPREQPQWLPPKMTKFCNARATGGPSADSLVSDYPPPEGCCEWSSYLVITDTIAHIISVCQAFLPKDFQQVWGRLKHGDCLRPSQPATVAPTHIRPQTPDH